MTKIIYYVKRKNENFLLVIDLRLTLQQVYDVQ